MTRKRIAGLAVAAGIATLAVSAPSATASPYEGPPAKRQYPQCRQEDDRNCVWLNHGPGYSFVSGPVVINPNAPQEVYRVSNRLANKLIARHGSWQRPEDWIGTRVDDTHGGSFVVNRRTVVSIGGTTYFIRQGRVGTS